MLRRARLGRAACSATLRCGALPRRTRLRAHAPRYARRSIGVVLWAWDITSALAHLRAPDKQSTSPPKQLHLRAPDKHSTSPHQKTTTQAHQNGGKAARDFVWRRRVGVLPTVARPVGSLGSPPPRRFVAGRLASLPPPPLLLAPPRLCTTLEQVRQVKVVQRDGVIQRYWVSHRVLVAPSPVVALSLREALPLGVRGSSGCSRCRFGLVLPLFLALLRRYRHCRSSTIVY